MKEYPQGSTIRFLIKFKDNDSLTLNSFDSVTDYVVLVYTQPHNPVRFSKIPKNGFTTLHRIDSRTMLGVITGNQSKTMLGDLMLQQKVVYNLESPVVEDITVSPVIETGITIIESLINEM